MTDEIAAGLNKLDGVQIITLLDHLRGAVRARQTQWDHERCIEKLLGCEVELHIPDVAACCDNPQTLSVNSLMEVLGQ